MADPITWMTIASVASAGVQAVQGYQQGQAEAAMAGQNAQIARDNAARARLDGAMAEEAQRREARKALGRSAAAASQSGGAAGGPNTGSYGALLTQSSREAELDALNIRYGAESEAHGNLVQAAQFDMERKAAKQRARGAVVSGILGMASAGLSGYSDYRVAKAGRVYRGSTRPGTSKPRPVRATTQNAPLIKPYGGR